MNDPLFTEVANIFGKIHLFETVLNECWELVFTES